MADRGIESLAMLFMVLAISSVALVPNCSYPVLVVALGGIVLVTVVTVQRGYLRYLDEVHRRTTSRMAWLSRSALLVITIGGGLLAGDRSAGLYLVLAGILLSFLAAGVNAWVLLVEINR